MAETEIVRDKRRVLEHLQTSRKFMPYLHSDMSAHGVVKLLGSRDRAQRALTALVQDGKIRYLENCSPDHYQAYAAPTCPAPYANAPVPGRRELLDEIQRLHARVAELERESGPCDCTQGPDFEGPCAWCDVHGQPSVAYRQGLAEGRKQEREVTVGALAVEPGSAS